MGEKGGGGELKFFKNQGGGTRLSPTVRGKATIIEKASSASEARELLRECGDQLPILDHVLENLKMFFIKYVYGR